MKYFKKILAFGKPYINRVWLTTIFNIFYAIFNILTVLSFIPVLGILFDTNEKKEYVKPVYKGFTNSFDF